MMVIIGAIIVIGVIYLLLKRHESRMVLIAAGILMAVIAGKPMAALDAFAKSMPDLLLPYVPAWVLLWL